MSAVQPVDDDEPEMLKIEEAAARLRIGRSLAYRLHREGLFPVPVLKLGRTLRVSRSLLEQYMHSGSVAS